YWIGVYDYKQEQSWVWISDNKTVNMSYWNNDPELFTNQRCGFISYEDYLRIFDGGCSIPLYYICMSL
ncbi:C-type lectin BiL isoform X2, partial [Biomphalaria glabrata]